MRVLEFLRGDRRRRGTEELRRGDRRRRNLRCDAMLRAIRCMPAVADWGRRGLLPDALDVDGFGVDGFQRSIAGFADGDFARRVYELNLQRAATS
jgi:hypothetical protein